jgi:hypothetical protein
LDEGLTQQIEKVVDDVLLPVVLLQQDEALAPHAADESEELVLAVGVDAVPLADDRVEEALGVDSRIRRTILK